MPIVINGSTGISGTDGSAATPVVQGTDTNTGMFFPAADQIAFAEGGTEVMRIDASGNIGIGTTTPGAKLDVNGNVRLSGNGQLRIFEGTNTRYVGIQSDNAAFPAMNFVINGITRTTIDTDGNFLFSKTTNDTTSVGVAFVKSGGSASFVGNSTNTVIINRLLTDGTLIDFRQDSTSEGSISVSGTTVSYNGGHLARWSQLPAMQRDPALLKGTVLSNLDEMCEWLDAEGNPLPNEQLNRVKVSDVEGDPNVAGVFVNWDNDDEANASDMNIAMTGDMIIRIAAGVVVQKGDLLMSAGNGTAKPQGDDIRRAKTVAKVTSNHVTCTYDDGSYCVPCVLMAC